MVDVLPEEGRRSEVCGHSVLPRMLTIMQVNGSQARRPWGCTVNHRGRVPR